MKTARHPPTGIKPLITIGEDALNIPQLAAVIAYRHQQHSASFIIGKAYPVAANAFLFQIGRLAAFVRLIPCSDRNTGRRRMLALYLCLICCQPLRPILFNPRRFLCCYRCSRCMVFQLKAALCGLKYQRSYADLAAGLKTLPA